MVRRILFFLTMLAVGGASAQQVSDENFNPPIKDPAYASGKGPVIALDEAHRNYHTLSGRYQGFARLLERDGYRLRANTLPFREENLQEIDLLVIANALPQGDVRAPTPSAFTDAEIVAVRRWVEAGGSLLLIADHMPYGGAASKLAQAFGATYSNGFVRLRDKPVGSGIITFARGPGGLRDHPISNGRNDSEKIESVIAFIGSAFEAKDARPLLELGPDYVSLLTEVPWEFSDKTPQAPVGGWLQGGTVRVGKGRVAMFGEAAMFSAQLAGEERRPMGMNAPGAEQNAQFLLNLMHWLSGLLGE